MKPKNQNTTEFLIWNPNGESPHGRKRQRSEDSGASNVKENADPPRKKVPRGTWSNDRRLRLLKSFFKHDPFSVHHGEHTAQWLKVVKDVNKVDSETDTPLKQQAVMHQFDHIMEAFAPIFSSGKADNLQSSSNPYTPDIEQAAHKVWNMESVKASRKDKWKSQQQQDEEKRLEDMAINGMKYHLRSRKINGQNQELVGMKESRSPESVATSSSVSQDKENSPSPLVMGNQAEILQKFDILHDDNQKIILALVNIGTKLNTMIDILSKKK